MKTIHLLGALSAGVIWSGLQAQQSQALPSLTPHRNVPGTIFWEEDGTEDGSDDHNHLFDHTVQGSAGANHVHDAFAVWDNRTYRYDVGNDTFAGGLKDDFWHGFIEPGQEPRYRFLDGAGTSRMFDITSQGLIADAVSEWVRAAKAQSEGRKTEDGSSLVTGIGLTPTNGANFEIRIGFFDNLIEQRNALAEWLVSDEQIWTDSGLTNADLDTSPILAFDDDIDWLFDTTQTPMGTQYDFSTIALHELGHVFGLLHAPGDPAGNIMRVDIQAEARDGNTLRTVDVSSANGAAELYTQPVPEPSSTVGFLGGAIIFMAGWVRRNRREVANEFALPSQVSKS